MTAEAAVSRSGTLIPLEDRAAWDAALADVPHAFAHTWDNCSAMAASSGHSTFLYSYRAGGGRVVCPLAERPIGREADVVTPYGFSGFAGTGECPGLAAEWHDFAE